ncbi:MAG: hypothetical protein PHV49_05360 [Alistipes sp.]|nr:hypothetical protein [Alistipes sp.]
MKPRILTKWIGLLSLGFIGCHATHSLPADYMSGMFFMEQDTAYLQDCATERIFPLGNNPVLAQLIEQYHRETPPPTGELYLRCRGSFGLQQEQVVWNLSQVLDLSAAKNCSAQFLLAGSYRCTDPETQQLLLRPDYTYLLLRFTAQGEHTEEGIWGLSAESELVLNPTHPTGGQHRFQILYDTETLMANDGNQPYAFNRIYLE